MKIKDLLQHTQPSFSFEFFPPKDDAGAAVLYAAIEHLKVLDPSFVSVTYGAGGATRERTIAVVSKIAHEVGLLPMAHLTCVGSSRAELDEILAMLRKQGIENVLALRGDPPQGEDAFVPAADGYAYASDLVHHIAAKYDLCIGVAGYPEGHPECPDKEQDLAHLKHKVEQGADFIITQLFFSNADYFYFVERARAAGIAVPIIPGIMPITNQRQVEKFTTMCGASIPPDVKASLDRIGDDKEELFKYGVAYAVQQCHELLDHSVPGIHLYTLNKSSATYAIVKELKETRGI